MKVSTIILNSDNRDIKKTLASVGFCDEVIVWQKPVDGNWAAARNEAKATAKNDWVLFVGSDEMVTRELKDEIQKLSEGDGVEGYYLKRRDVFWGRELKYGEVGNVKLLRFGNKNAGNWVRRVHEFWDIKNTRVLKNPLRHYPHQTVREFITSINFYTDIDADELYKDGKKVTFFRLIANPLGKFLRNYFLNFGFLDGPPGFVYAFLMSFHSLTVRVKMAAKYGFSGLF